MITPENATKVKDLVAPGVTYKVERGMQMHVVPTQRVDWPPPYKDATEKYSSQVRLYAGPSSLLGYVAGQPFPLIDANDQERRCEDSSEQRVSVRSLRTITIFRFYDCDTEYQAKGPQKGQIEYFQLGH